MTDKKDKHNPSTKTKSSKSTKDSSTKEKSKEKSNTDVNAGSTAKAKPPEPSNASTTPTPTVLAKTKPTDRGTDSNTLEYTHTEPHKHTGDKPTHSQDDSSTMPTEAVSSSSRTSNDRLGSKRKAQDTDGNCHPTKTQAMGTGTLPDPSNAGDWVLKALQSIFPNGLIPSMTGPVAGNTSSPQQQTQAPVASPPPPPPGPWSLRHWRRPL